MIKMKLMKKKNALLRNLLNITLIGLVLGFFVLLFLVYKKSEYDNQQLDLLLKEQEKIQKTPKEDLLRSNVQNLLDGLNIKEESNFKSEQIFKHPKEDFAISVSNVVSYKLKNEDFVLVAMGCYGLSSRILANFMGSYFVYTFSEGYIKKHSLNEELLDPHTLCSTYNFNKINAGTHIFGIVGAKVNSSLSPSLHNAKFKENEINSVYIPISAKNVDEACEFVKYLGIRAISVTNPFKESIIPYIDELEETSSIIGSVNTVSCFGKKSVGYNTDIYGFEKALLEFLKDKRTLKISVLGAGGASKAVCYVLKKLNFKDVVVFNRTQEKAKIVASLYGFGFASLDVSNLKILKEHSDLIINATSVSGDENILPFYEFSGSEYVFDLTYNPEKTLLLQNAEEKKCKICNGYAMLKYQAEEQFKIFRGDKHDKH